MTRPSPTASFSIRWVLKLLLAGLAIVAALCPTNAQDRVVDHFILALNWQPAFCQYRPHLPECPLERGDPAANPATLALHGLWPNATDGEVMVYCGVEPERREQDAQGQWCEIPALSLSGETSAMTADIMPGTLSCLERHEWLKHGTCSGFDTERYFRLATTLAGAVARSELARALEAARGGIVATRDLRGAFERSFGDGSDRALSLRCRKDGGRTYLSAIWVRLHPMIREVGGVGESIDPELLDTRGDGRDRSCTRHIYIDEPGL